MLNLRKQVREECARRRAEAESINKRRGKLHLQRSMEEPLQPLVMLLWTESEVPQLPEGYFHF